MAKAGGDVPLNDRQCRWVEALMPFALSFEYVPGELNGVSDALSRSPWLAAAVTVVRAGGADVLKLMRVAAEQDPAYRARKDALLAEEAR